MQKVFPTLLQNIENNKHLSRSPDTVSQDSYLTRKYKKKKNEARLSQHLTVIKEKLPGSKERTFFLIVQRYCRTGDLYLLLPTKS
jgi:hypothetical protein